AVGHGAAGDVVALPGDDVHVLAVGPDVTGGDVAPAQRLHEPAVGAQQRLGLVRGRIADEHGLAAAVVEPGEGVLVGHGAGEVEHVGEGLLLGGVRVEPRAAEARAERGTVDRDDRVQPAALVRAEHHLLMSAGARECLAVLVGQPEDAGHAASFGFHTTRAPARSAPLIRSVTVVTSITPSAAPLRRYHAFRVNPDTLFDLGPRACGAPRRSGPHAAKRRPPWHDSCCAALCRVPPRLRASRRVPRAGPLAVGALRGPAPPPAAGPRPGGRARRGDPAAARRPPDPGAGTREPGRLPAPR